MHAASNVPTAEIPVVCLLKSLSMTALSKSISVQNNVYNF